MLLEGGGRRRGHTVLLEGGIGIIDQERVQPDLEHFVFGD